MIFYRISKLILPAFIQRYDKNHFIFDPLQKTRGYQIPHFMVVLILYINLLNLSWIKKKTIFEEYGAFNEQNDMRKGPYVLISSQIISLYIC